MSNDTSKLTRKSLFDAVKHLRRLRRTEGDRLSEKQRDELASCIQQLETAGGTRHGLWAWLGWLLSWPFLQISHLLGYSSPEPAAASYNGGFSETSARPILARAEALYSRLSPRTYSPVAREWADVILVAAVVAIGVRSYYLQPFKIPTNSMYPTLRGVVVTPLPEDAALPAPPLRWLQHGLFGRVFYEVEIPANSRLEDIRPSGAWIFQKLHFKFINPNGEIRWVINTEMTERDFLGSPLMAMINHPTTRTLRFQVDTGDHLFVNKILYHFRSPQRGDSFVFRTLNLDTDGNGRPVRDPLQGSQFYIKRCVAVGEDTITVRPPELLIDGQPAPEPAIRRVWQGNDPTHPQHDPAYRGYAYGIAEHRMRYLTAERPSYTLPPDTYWAMGDNSYNSLDSRLFGPVPIQNVIGKAAIIYYPFNRFLKTIQ